MSAYQSSPVPHHSPTRRPPVKLQVCELGCEQFLKCLVSQTSEGDWMSFLHMEKPVSPDGRGMVGTGYETGSPELFSSSHSWGLSLKKRKLLQPGDCWRVWRTQRPWAAADTPAAYQNDTIVAFKSMLNDYGRNVLNSLRWHSKRINSHWCLVFCLK